MNKKYIFSLFLILVLFISFSTIHAADINESDTKTLNSIESNDIQIEDGTQFDTLSTVTSDILSTNDDSTVLEETVKNQTELISTSNTVYGYYNVTLKDSNTSTALANKEVIFVVNKVNYAATTDENGIAGVNLGTTPGTYTVSAYFAGDDAYDSSKLTAKVKVLSTVKASNISKYYMGSTKYTATFFDIYGNLLANTAVNITVNGNTYSKKTNSKGVVSMAINLKPGTYKVVSVNPVTGYQISTTFKILSTITSSDLKKVIGDSKKFTATFYKSNGNVLSKQYVKFKINGKTYNVKTYSNGKASLNLNNFKKGTYKIICYNKDGLSKTNTVTLYSIANTKLTTDSDFYTFLPNQTRKVKIKLTTSLGDSSNVGKSIKITFDGKNYYRKTNSDGIAAFYLTSFDKGFYSVVYSYGGNKYFKSSTVSNSVTLLDSVNTKLTVKSTTDFGYGAGTELKVAFTAGGVPLVKRTMTFTIEGKTYTTTTDNNGIGSVPIDLNIGKYTISYKTNTKYNVSGTSGSCSITVFERSDAKLTWKSGTSYKDSSQSFKVLLTDLNGTAISGQTVELTIDGETYTGKTASNGYVTIKTSVAIGKYNVFVKALGDNNFLPSNTSKSVNVKLSKYGNGINQKNTISYLSAYYKSTSNCQVNNAKIKSLVNSLTKGLTDDIDKAKALFNYVRDEISYSYYYNTYRGAVGTLNAKSGNCVDQAHLLIAMYRTAGFAARYVHGTCVFSDGTFGHVWTQVLIGNVWVVGDPISYKNSLGKINNWNTNNYKISSKYLSLPF